MCVGILGSKWIRKVKKNIFVIFMVGCGGLSEVWLDVWDFVGIVWKLIIFVLDLEL